MLHAAQRPFRQIVGVEISPALLEIAKDNRNTYTGTLVCRDLRLVRADAATFTFPRGDLTVYLYNPFRAEVLARVLEQLKVLGNREVVLLYHTPVERAVIDADGAFALIADVGFGLVYRFRRELEAGRRILGRA